MDPMGSKYNLNLPKTRKKWVMVGQFRMKLTRKKLQQMFVKG